jgi:3-oxoacyl-[acyl-carrier protein] reductase
MMRWHRFVGAYVASKGALNAMTLSLARALAPNIRVNAICSGYMDTAWFEKGLGAAAAERIRDTVKSNMPLRVAPTGVDIANASGSLPPQIRQPDR